MCHVPKNSTFSVVVAASAKVSAPAETQRVILTKSNTRLSPFRKIAKSARINLNRYWGLLNPKQQERKGSVSSTTSSSMSSMSMDFDHSAEEEQNRINELLEAQANAEEQNSINSQIEYDSSPEPPRKMFVRQRALASSYSSFASSVSSSTYYPYQYQQSQHHQYPCDFDDSISQDSVFL